MSRLTHATLAGSILLPLMAACGTAEMLPVQVESLRGNITVLRDSARRWRADAYLESASLHFGDGSRAAAIIWANFNSPSEDYANIAVRLLSDGSISVEEYPHSVPVVQTEPIGDDDWRVDSTEALEAGLNEEGVRYLEEHSEWNCSFLVLERNGREPGSPVVWRLVLTDCLDPWTSQEAIIDAMSGEVISREVHDGLTPLVVPTP